MNKNFIYNTRTIFVAIKGQAKIEILPAMHDSSISFTKISAFHRPGFYIRLFYCAHDCHEPLPLFFKPHANSVSEKGSQQLYT